MLLEEHCEISLDANSHHGSWNSILECAEKFLQSRMKLHFSTSTLTKMTGEPLFVQSCHAALVHPVPKRIRPTDIVALEASAETVNFKDDDSATLTAKRLNHSPLRPVQYLENSKDSEPADKVVEEEGRATETRKPVTGFFAKLALLEAGLKRLGFGNGTQQRQNIY